MTSFIDIKMVQGIGAGLILDGRLHRGTNGLADELAHIHIEDDGAVWLRRPRLSCDDTEHAAAC
jgi:predicted NBD/HSP70 family sugar kinase